MEHKSTFKCLLLAANCSIGSIFFGYALAYINVSLTSINVAFNIVENQSVIDGLIQALLPIGAAIGALSSGTLLQYLSRRQALIFTDILSSIGFFLSQFLNLNLFFFARLIIGISVGFNSTIIPLYIREFAPKELSGSMGSIFQAGISLGVLIAFILAFGFPSNPDNIYWRFMLAFPLIFTISRIISFLFIYVDDPPIYYIHQKQSQKAEEVLKQIYKDEFVAELLEECEREERSSKMKSQSYKDLFQQCYRRVFLGCFLGALQQFCGINAIMFYSSSIFDEITNGNIFLINLFNIFVGVINISCSIIAGLIIQKIGRKPILIFGIVICFLSLSALSWYGYLQIKDPTGDYGVTNVSFIFIYLIGFQVSLGPVIWIYLADILPEKGMAIAVLVLWVATSIVAQLFPVLKDAFNMSFVFGIFAFFCVVGFVVLIIYIPETKGKSPLDIELLFSKDRNLITLDRYVEIPEIGAEAFRQK